MNSNSAANYSFESMSRRSSLCPPHHDSDSVLSPPLTPALSQHHPFDKRQSADLSYSPNHYNARPTYSMDTYHHWMNHSATMQHMQQQQQQQQIHHHQQQQHHQQQPMHHHRPQQHHQHMLQSPIPLPQQVQQQHQHHQQQQQQQQQVMPPQPTSTQQRTILTDRSGATSTRKQPSKQNKHMCTFPECLWSFKRFEHLKRHMLVHTGERPHVCPHPGCGKRFSRSDNFHAHYRTHEKKAFARQKNNNNNATSQAPQPDLSVNTSTMNTTPSNFLIKDEKDFMQQPYYHHHPYPLLPTPSNNMYNQQQHYTTLIQQQQDSPIPSSRSTLHNNSISSSSSSTSSTTSSSNNIKSSSIVKGEQKKPHACSHQNCDRRFRRLEHLKRHMRIHTHEQPFKCNYPGCLKAFSRSDNLTQHRKTHERRGSRYQQQQQQVIDPVVPVTTATDYMHTHASNGNDSFTLVDFIRDSGHNNNYDNNKQQHSILGWQHPGDTTAESVGC